MNWYIKVIKQYADFSGRASRTEYWMFVLFNILFCLAAMVLDYILAISVFDLRYIYFGDAHVSLINLINFLYTLFVFIPGIAVGVRRLHDVGKSGWMILISLVPCVGGIWLLVLMLSDSMPIENQYGPVPQS
jgi:uncharacterized membrane protein YhaH (DUF805 family)